jgi:ketosteroid isomerase-like protein
MLRRETIHKFFTAVNARSVDEMSGLLRSDAAFYFPKTDPLLGKDRILRFFKILFRQFPELVFDVNDIIVEADRAAVHWTNRGTNRKKEPYANEGVTLLEWKEDGFSFLSDFFKDTKKF